MKFIKLSIDQQEKESKKYLIKRRKKCKGEENNINFSQI